MRLHVLSVCMKALNIVYLCVLCAIIIIARAYCVGG